MGSGAPLRLFGCARAVLIARAGCWSRVPCRRSAARGERTHSASRGSALRSRWCDHPRQRPGALARRTNAVDQPRAGAAQCQHARLGVARAARNRGRHRRGARVVSIGAREPGAAETRLAAESYLAELGEQRGFRVVAAGDVQLRLAADLWDDRLHLGREGARIFSESLVPALAEALLTKPPQ